MQFRLVMMLFVTTLALLSAGCESDDTTDGPAEAGTQPAVNADSSAADSVSSDGNAVSSVPDGTVDAGATPDVSTPTPGSDVSAASDTASAEDAGGSVDATEGDDAAASEDSAAPQDTAAPEDVTVVPDEGPSVPDESDGACDNEADIAQLAEQADIVETLKDCALGCLGEEACSKQCVIDEVGVSDGCADCFGQSIACTMMNCAFHCLDATSQGCITCQEEKCNDAFVECAGVENPEL